ncbi:MAG: ABC transporter permease [Theionarchaea archaeon]|nr:ABC transporter permease [Theionarchaea archaeon]
MKVIGQLERSLAVAKKDLLVYFLKGPTLIFGLLLPSFLFIAFAIGRDLSVEFLMPGLLGMTVFFTTSAVGPVIAPWETRMRTFERLVSSPIAFWGIILGDVIASSAFGLFITVIVLTLGALVEGVGIITGYLVVATVLSSFCFSSLGLMLSSHPTSDPSRIMMLSTLIKFPLFLISDVFIPLSEMTSARFVSMLSPLTYYVDLARLSIEGTGYLNPGLDVVALALWGSAFFAIAVLLHEKNLDKRF